MDSPPSTPYRLGLEMVYMCYITGIEIILKEINVKMLSSNNIKKRLFPQMFIMALKNNFEKHLTCILKKVYIFIAHFIPQ